MKSNVEILDYFQNEDETHILYDHVCENFKINSCGYHKTPRNYAYGPIIRDYILVHFVIKGSGLVTVKNHEYEVLKGGCFICLDNELQYYKADEDDPWEYYYIGFNCKKETLRLIGFEDNCVVRYPQKFDEIIHLLKKLCYNGTHKESSFKIQSMIYDFAYCLESSTIEEKILPNILCKEEERYIWKDNITNIVQGIINSSSGEEISAKSISKSLGFSEGHLNKLFKKSFSMTINEYITEYRLLISKDLLKSTDLSIKKIAEKIAFKDALYFSRVFSKKYNCSPSEYRKK